jgi:hypothetical protein
MDTQMQRKERGKKENVMRTVEEIDSRNPYRKLSLEYME